MKPDLGGLFGDSLEGSQYARYVGDCQNYGPFLGPYYSTGPNTGPNLGDLKRDHNFDNPPCIWPPKFEKLWLASTLVNIALHAAKARRPQAVWLRIATVGSCCIVVAVPG